MHRLQHNWKSLIHTEHKTLKWHSLQFIELTCSQFINKKVNVYLPSLMMKVPNPLYVLGDTYTRHTYCCYAYHFYAYWLYFIYVWHVYVSPKTYKWFGTFIIKDGRYTFTFVHCVKSRNVRWCAVHVSLPLPYPLPDMCLHNACRGQCPRCDVSVTWVTRPCRGHMKK
jgi:hypothetical protein